jgi:hypothetical protein
MRVLFLTFTLNFGLFGCAGEARVFQDATTMLWRGNAFKDRVSDATMNPAYRYLLVQNARSNALMVLGYSDLDLKTSKPVEVWYSGSKEVIKFQDGRVIATAGLANDWLAVRYEVAPDWAQLLGTKAQTITTYTRSIDLKNSYQFNQTQKVTLTRIAQPTGHALQGIARPDAVWFQEKAEPSQLPASIYAVVPNWHQTGHSKVIYTWHCFSRDDCFGFQEWTVQDQARAAKP